MNKNKLKSASIELPDHIRGLIDGEIVSGLDRFRKGGFEARMRAAEASIQKEGAFPARPFLMRRAPALTAALAAAALLFAVVLFRPFHSSAPDFRGGRDALIAALQKAPGLVAVQRIHADPLYAPIPADSANSPLSRPLALVVATSATASAEEVRLPELVPRYDLRKKIDILVNERPIERALAVIKLKTGDTYP